MRRIFTNDVAPVLKSIIFYITIATLHKSPVYGFLKTRVVFIDTSLSCLQGSYEAIK